ncbi:MAG: hypothetical protein QM737_02495 [Ferruginibacter sp.]
MAIESNPLFRLPVSLPENFDADSILNPLKLRKDVQANIKASMYYILDTLYHMANSRQWRDYYDEFGGYPLQAEILNKLLGKRYSEALRLLETAGVITRTKGYEVGEQSKLVKLTDKYASVNHKIREIPLDSSLYKKLLKSKKKYDQENYQALQQIPFVTKWFDKSRLSVDLKKVHGFIEFYRIELENRIPQKLPTGRSKIEIEARITQRVNSMIDTINRLSSGDLHLKKIGLDHRLHSILTSTKKELRTLYQYDSSPLVSIDLKASQPYLLTHLLNPEFWKKESKILIPELHPQLSGIKLQQQLSSILMFVTSPKMQDSKGFQGINFNNFPWKDDLYNYIVKRAEKEGYQKLFPDRTTVKKKMMMILYDDGVHMDRDSGFLLFQKWFPQEADMILFFKQLSRKKKEQLAKKGLKIAPGTVINYLPILLQRLESKLILEDICKRISQEIPAAPLLPVHDCILTTEKYADDIKQIVGRELKKITGIEPGLTVELYNHQQTLDDLKKLAADDMTEILEKKPKRSMEALTIKPPLMLQVPEKGNDWLIHSRYFDPNYLENFDPDEKIFVLIDDTNSKE